jgi:hypothetical protein
MKIATLAIAVCVIAAPAFAQQQVKPPVDPKPAGSHPEVPKSPWSGQPTADRDTLQQFATIDADKNGSLSMAELNAFDAKEPLIQFERFDSDNNKELSTEEYRSFLVAQVGTAGPVLPTVPPTPNRQ